MASDRRELLILAGTGLGALLAGGLVATLGLQSADGMGKLLAAEFVDLSGRRRRLGEWQGRVAAFNFWATWCVPCREEVPLLDSASHKYGALGFSVIGIGIDSAANVQQFAANYKVTYPMLIAGPEAIELMKALGNNLGGLPFSVVLNRSGQLVHRKLGAFAPEELPRLIEPLLR